MQKQSELIKKHTHLGVCQKIGHEVQGMMDTRPESRLHKDIGIHEQECSF